MGILQVSHDFFLSTSFVRSLRMGYRSRASAVAFTFVIAMFVSGCGSSGGNGKTPPSGLSYAQPSISATMNVAISSDTPTVTGTVSAYDVSPSLPAGLTLGPTTGTITGTPTALSAKASYSVTASNAAGATSATIQIAVLAPVLPPDGLMYPQTTITTFVGQAITPDLPGTAGGPITSYSVSPALPPGLSLNPSTGVISGTPTAAAAQNTYVVTGSNSGGSVTAAVSPTIMVNATPNILLQLGNQNEINNLQFVNSSVLSQDIAGLWALRNYTSGAIVANGDAALGKSSGGIMATPPAEMAGPTLAIGIVGGIEVLSSASGQPLSTIVSPGYGMAPNTTATLQENDAWQLATDGSYIAVETQLGLFVYTPSGQLLFTQPGNYLPGVGIVAFAAPGQVQVANVSAGVNTIQTISVPAGTSTVSAPFQGQFKTWFTDGGGFLTADGGTVWTYSRAGIQQAAIQLAVPSGSNGFIGSNSDLGGEGNWIWTFGFNTSLQATLNIYAIGSTTPALTYTDPDIAGYATSGTTLAVLPFYKAVSIIDLSGATPVKTDYAVPPPINHAFAEEYPVGPYAAVSSTQWVAGFEATAGGNIVAGVNNFFPASGLILDGASLSASNPRYLGTGALLSLAGSTANVAIATGNGEITDFDPTSTTPLGSINLTSGELELSSDGSVLAAESGDATLLNIYSLPSGTVSNDFTYSGQSAPGLLFDFALSGSGTTLGQIQAYSPTNGTTDFTLQVTPVSGGAPIWSSPASISSTQSMTPSILLSPDGTLIAVTEGSTVLDSAVTIYQNGTQVAAVTGVAVGWIDDGRLLVNDWGFQGPVISYAGCTIYSPTGAALGAPPLPQLQSIQPVTSDTVYASAQNTIYSLTTGQPTWTSPYLPGSWDQAWIGAVAGQYVVFESEGNVIAVPYSTQ
jgi:hypothetical protein